MEKIFHPFSCGFSVGHMILSRVMKQISETNFNNLQRQGERERSTPQQKTWDETSLFKSPAEMDLQLEGNVYAKSIHS